MNNAKVNQKDWRLIKISTGWQVKQKYTPVEMFNSEGPAESYTPERIIFETGVSQEDTGIAHLIAAAPEMLKVLKNLMDYPQEDLKEWANGSTPITMSFTPTVISQAINAITKAEGGSHE